MPPTTPTASPAAPAAYAPYVPYSPCEPCDVRRSTSCRIQPSTSVFQSLVIHAVVIGGLEAEAELPQCLQDRLLHRQGPDPQLVEVALVLGARHRQLGAYAEHDAQALPVQLGDRSLPRQSHAERHTAQLTLGEPEAAPDGEPVEDDDTFTLALPVLGLDPRHQLHGDVRVFHENGAARPRVDTRHHAGAARVVTPNVSRSSSPSRSENALQRSHWSGQDFGQALVRPRLVQVDRSHACPLPGVCGATPPRVFYKRVET